MKNNVTFGNKFSQRERLLIDLIAEIKEFGIKNFGFKETENFKKFEENPQVHNRLFYQKKTEIAFSYIDPILISKECQYNTLKENLPLLEKEGITLSEYDMFFYVTDGIEGEAILTRQSLKRSEKEFIKLIFHEDAHNNLGLPLNIEEAAAVVIDCIATEIFLGSNEDKITDALEEHPFGGGLIELLHGWLVETIAKYKNREITFCDLEHNKTQICKNSFLVIESTAHLSFYRTYSYYFDLLHKLFLALKCDLRQFVLTMRSFNSQYSKPIGPYGSAEYFAESRAKEMKIEEEIKNIIKNS